MVQKEYPTRKTNRLQEYHYGLPNAYFITSCTENRRNLFWKTVGAVIDRPEERCLTELGRFTVQRILEIPVHYPDISVDHYVIMPDHIHLLLRIHGEEGGRSMIAPTISRVIRLLKGTVSKQAGFSVWQKGFYDHVVRGEEDYREIWNYIEENPGKWLERRAERRSRRKS